MKTFACSLPFVSPMIPKVIYGFKKYNYPIRTSAFVRKNKNVETCFPDTNPCFHSFVSDSVIARDKSLLKIHSHGLMSQLGLMFKLYHLHNLCL